MCVQVAANDFIQSSRPITPESDYQDPPSQPPEQGEPAEVTPDYAHS